MSYFNPRDVEHDVEILAFSNEFINGLFEDLTNRWLTSWKVGQTLFQRIGNFIF